MWVDLLHGLRSGFCTLFKRNKCTNSVVKIVVYNATCTDSHRDVEERLVPFPPVAYLTSGPETTDHRGPAQMVTVPLWLAT